MANWANTRNVGDPLSAGWQDENLAWIEPIKGQRWQVYKPAQTAFEGLLNDLIKLGYHPTSSGGFNYRNIRGGDSLSQHAFGNAIDLNSMTNSLGQSATDIPHAAELAKKWGLEWGGNWKGRPDPMHFEWTGGGGAGDAQMNASGQMGPAMPKSITDWSPEQRRNAIASIESAGSGDYKALGKQLGGPHGGDRAYGRYQIMGANIPAWSKEVLGRAVTPQEFLADPKIQDAIFDKKFGDYVRKYGEESAAQAWFGGEGSIGKTNLKDALGTDLGSYGQKYLKALTGQSPGGATQTYPDQQTPAAVAANQPAIDPSGQGDGKKSDFDMDAFTADVSSLFGGGGAGGGGARKFTPSPAPQIIPGMTEGLSSSTALTPEAARARMQLALTRLNSGKLV